MKSFRFSPPLSGVTAAVGSLFGKPEDIAEKIVEVDKNGTALYKEDIIRRVLDDLEKRRTERSGVEAQWTLNANFLVGNQFCEINPYKGNGIEQLEPVYNWLNREAFNNIAPLIETRIANLKKIKYMMKVKPATNELSDYDKADVSTAILQHTQKATDFESKKNTMVYWEELCGNCFWLSWWDTSKGQKCAVQRYTELDENGQEVQREKVFFQGDLDYGLLTPYEVFPESIFKQGVESQRSIIIEQVKSIDEIYDLYGIEVEGSNIETFELTPVAAGGGLGYENTVISLGHRTAENAEKVVTYFEKPSRQRPNGQMIIIVGDEHLVYYGDLPYSQIPIVQVVCHEVAGQFFGKSTITDLIPFQRSYNGCLNSLHEYIKRLSLGNLSVEEGSIDIEFYEDEGLAPGAFLVYKQGKNPPKPVENGNLPSEIMQERFNLKNDMEYVAGVSQLMVSGNAPQTNMSGAAISNLMEIDNTRLSLTGDHIRNSVRKLAIMWLEIYKKYANTRRIINYIGTNNIAKAISWSSDDINSYDVDYTTENELMMSEEMQKQRFFDAFNMGLFNEDSPVSDRVRISALEMFKLGQYSDLLGINTLQIQAAQRENELFERGVIPKIADYDDHDIHIEEHLRYVLQMDFQLMKMKKPDYASALEKHLNDHKEIQKKQEQQELLANLPGVNPGIM